MLQNCLPDSGIKIVKFPGCLSLCRGYEKEAFDHKVSTMFKESCCARVCYGQVVKTVQNEIVNAQSKGIDS